MACTSQESRQKTKDPKWGSKIWLRHVWNTYKHLNNFSDFCTSKTPMFTNAWECTGPCHIMHVHANTANGTGLDSSVKTRTSQDTNTRNHARLFGTQLCNGWTSAPDQQNSNYALRMLLLDCCWWSSGCAFAPLLCFFRSVGVLSTSLVWCSTLWLENTNFNGMHFPRIPAENQRPEVRI